MKQFIEQSKKDLSNILIYLNRFFDKMEKLDRRFYGKRLPYFIILFVFTLIIAPALDEKIFGENEGFVISFLSNVFFLFFTTVSILTWISSWRDDNNQWTFTRAKERINTYLEILKEKRQLTISKTKHERIYSLSKMLLFTGILLKTFENLNQFVRNFFKALDIEFLVFQRIEYYASSYWDLLIWTALGLFLFLLSKDKSFKRLIVGDILKVFNLRLMSDQKNFTIDSDKVSSSRYNLVYNNKSEDHISEAKSLYNDRTMKSLLNVLNSWSFKYAPYEFQYRERLYRELKKKMPNSNIMLEKPIDIVYNGRKGRADIIIDDTILIELKRDSSTSAIDRASGQIERYSESWNGHVLLVLFDFDYNYAQQSFSKKMTDISKSKKSIATIVMFPK